MFETCDEWDAIVPRWKKYDLGRIRSYKASIPIVSFTHHCNTIPIYTRDSGEYIYSGGVIMIVYTLFTSHYAAQ